MLTQISQPAVSPVAVSEVCQAGRIDEADFNAQLAIIIPALVQSAEAIMGRPIINRTYELVLDAFPAGEIDLVLPGVSTITWVKYIDSAGIQQTLDSSRYALDKESVPCWLLPADGQEWPDAKDIANAVRVRFIAGFGDAATDVPEDIKFWIIARAVQVLGDPIAAEKTGGRSFVDRLLDRHCVMVIT